MGARSKTMVEMIINDKKTKVMQIDDWRTSIDNDFKPGDFFDADIAWELINCVPPL